ncbi:hypothetical protein [Streptomyces radiopugnans]
MLQPISNAYVPTAGMAGRLRAAAERNPVGAVAASTPATSPVF